MMRATSRQDGANVQTYVETISTSEDGTVDINFVTLAVSKSWAEANARDDAAASAMSTQSAETGTGSVPEGDASAVTAQPADAQGLSS